MGYKPYFILDENCVFVDGAKRAALYDLKSGEVFSIDPHSKRVIGSLREGNTIDDVFKLVKSSDKEKLLEYLHRLEENNLGTFSDDFRIRQEPEYSLDPILKLDYLWLELKKNCNLRCLHCYSDSEGGQVKAAEELSFDEWKRLLQDGYNLGCRAMQFIGGEPLLYGDHLFDLAAFARELGYESIEIFSNLTILKDRWLDLIAKYQVKVATSIYSARPEIHDLVTTKKGSFQRTMKAVEKFKARNIPVRFALTIMKQNQDYADETLEFLKKLGGKNPNFDVARPCGRANDDELVPNKYQWVRKEASFGRVDKEAFLKRYRGNSCWQGKISISSTGDAMPCIMQRAEPIGNVREKSLTEIIEGGLQKYWCLSRDQIDGCKDCEYRYACKDCRPVSRGPSGQLKAKDVNCLYNPYKGEFVQDISR